MQVKSSGELSRTSELPQVEQIVAGLGRAQRAGVLALNLIPLLHLSLVVMAAAWLSEPWRWFAAGAAVYLLPPIMVRLLFLCRRSSEGRIVLGSPDFFVWWASLQWQVLFCRLPALEELLRLVPALYSAWLRLWGAQVGRLTYWSPGTLVLDRSFLELGDDVVFGAGVRLNPHVLVKNPAGETELLLARIKIGDRAVIGGYSLLTAGTEIAADEVTRACLISPPFSVWRSGKRVRGRGGQDSIPDDLTQRTESHSK